MKKSTQLIFMICVLLIGVINVNKQEHSEIIKQKGNVEKIKESANELLKVSEWNDIQNDQYLIKPLEEYPFDCDVLYYPNQQYSRC